MKGPRVLLCLARAGEARRLADHLQAAGQQTEVREGPFAWPALLAECDADVLIVDATELERGLCAHTALQADAPALLALADFASAEDAVEAVRRGVAQFLERPQTPEQIAVAVERAAESRSLHLENLRLRRDLGERFSIAGLISRDPQLARIAEVVTAVADTRTTVLITGESGTGKTLLARALHQASSRRALPFVEVNCGALPSTLLESELFGHVRGAFTGATRDVAGRFQSADGGSIFLDEIATASLDLQVKLLRVIQDQCFERVGESVTRTVDTRVIAATNRDLEEEVRAGRFREDLFWRLNVIHLRLPPLRERRADVPLLAEHFLERHGARHGRSGLAFEPHALAALVAHGWPGNVRELENCVERAVLLARTARLSAEDLGLAPRHQEGPGPSPVGLPRAALPRGAAHGGRSRPGHGDGEDYPSVVQPLRQALEMPERELVERALELAGGHRMRAAALLGVTRGTLFNKMRKYGLLSDSRSTGRGAGHGPPGAAR
jgi:DNA-binding NtrC family response regulator